MKYILPIILIGSAIVGFFMMTEPLYNTISLQKEQITSYNEALDNSKALEAQRDELTQKYNSFDPSKMDRLQKLLPDNVDNIRLILEIENIASPYGMVIKDIKYDNSSSNVSTTTAQTAGVVQGGTVSTNASGQNYGTLNLEFSAQSTYSNFLSFLKDLENNLRIVDISSIDFSSDSNAPTGINSTLEQSYNYNFKIKTYWLKN